MPADYYMLAPTPTWPRDPDYERLAADGTVNPVRYLHDPVYHAIVWRMTHGLRDLDADTLRVEGLPVEGYKGPG